MSLALDLLDQAEHLAKREPKKPRQASLRRAISAAYYALFHLLIEDAAAFCVGKGKDRQTLRFVLQRAFGHQEMKAVAKAFAAHKVSEKVAPALPHDAQGNALVSADLQRVAEAFVHLQQARHEADYNLLRSFGREEAKDVVQQARDAFVAWSRVKASQEARVFMVALLAQRLMKGDP